MENIFSADELNSNTLFQTLSKRSKELIYRSETDARVEAFLLPLKGRAIAEVVADICGPDNDQIEVKGQEPGPFFERVTRKAEWHTDADRKRAETFRELQELLERSLRSVMVYRAGKVQVDIIVAGLDEAGNVIGIKTRSVET